MTKFKAATDVGSFQTVRDAVETATEQLTPIEECWLPLPEVAQILGKTEESIRVAIHRGTFPIPSEVLFGRRIFRVEDVHRYLAGGYLRGLEGLSKAKDRALPLSWESR